MFLPNAVFCRIRWQANDYGTVRWQLMVMQACTPLDESSASPACSRRALLHAEGEQSVRAVLRIDAIEALGIAPAAVSPAYWRTLANRLAARCPNTPPSGTPPGSSGAAMTAVSTTGTAPRPRLRLRARIVLAGLSACGLAALAWASFVHPLPRLTYNPSDSVAVGWYRVDPLDHRAARCHVGYPWAPSCWFRCRPRLPRSLRSGYLPTRIPLLKRVGAVAPQRVCIVGGSVRIDGVPSAAVLSADRWGRPLPSWQQCRRLRPGELFLLSVTNPASFDSRYFGRSAQLP